MARDLEMSANLIFFKPGQQRVGTVRKFYGFFAALSLLILPGPGNLARAEEDLPLPHLLHNLHSAGEMACHWTYGENHLTNDDRDKLKYYCSRLQHPGEWLQDQEWWKSRLPEFVRARSPVPAPALDQEKDPNCSRVDLPCLKVGPIGPDQKELEAHLPPSVCESAAFLSDQWLRCIGGASLPDGQLPNYSVGPNEKQLKALDAEKHPHFEKY